MINPFAEESKCNNKKCYEKFYKWLGKRRNLTIEMSDNNNKPNQHNRAFVRHYLNKQTPQTYTINLQGLIQSLHKRRADKEAKNKKITKQKRENIAEMVRRVEAVEKCSKGEDKKGPEEGEDKGA